MRVSETATVRKILNEWYPGTSVRVVGEDFNNMLNAVLLIRYPEAKEDCRISLRDTTEGIAEAIVASAKAYRASLIVEYHTIHNDVDYDE